MHTLQPHLLNTLVLKKNLAISTTMIPLATALGVAFGFTLPEIPDMPDLVQSVQSMLEWNFTEETVEEPKTFLPSIAEINAMSDEEKTDRFHWFFSVFVMVYVCFVLLGSGIMIAGAKLKARGDYQALGQTALLSKEALILLVVLSLVVTISLSFATCLWSVQTGRLSKDVGVDWEVYLFLFSCGGVSLLVQAVVAVVWLKAGARFDATAFPVASMSILPIVSDQFDTLKDIIFGALCFQSEHWAMKVLGVFSWLYLLAFHTWFVFCAAKKGKDGFRERFGPNPLGANCFSELAASHLSVLLTAPKVDGESSAGKTLNRAVQNGNLIAAKTIWEEAEVGEDIQFFERMLPRLRFLLDFMEHRDFKEPEEPEELGKFSEGELEVWRDIAEMLVLEKDLAKWDLDGKKIGNSGAKVVAKALKNTSTKNLWLPRNEIGADGAKALAEALKENRAEQNGLLGLFLHGNSIGDAGAQALGDALKENRSLAVLGLGSNNIRDTGAQALAAGLRENQSLKELRLNASLRDTRGGQALREAQKMKARRDDFRIEWHAEGT